jgi:hypothetical protein
LSYLPAYKVFPPPVRRRYLCAYKAPYSCTGFLRFPLLLCSFVPLFLCFYEVLMTNKHLFSRLKQNQCNLRNLRLINSCLYSLCLCAFLWLKNPRKRTSTKDYVRKNNLFMQNEPKFQKVKFNVTKVLTMDYDKMDTWSIGKNEPKTNPNEPKTNPNSKRPK